MNTQSLQVSPEKSINAFFFFYFFVIFLNKTPKLNVSEPALSAGQRFKSHPEPLRGVISSESITGFSSMPSL